jgi:hypothetical protein
MDAAKSAAGDVANKVSRIADTVKNTAFHNGRGQGPAG